jgi:hypothetical protein
VHAWPVTALAVEIARRASARRTPIPTFRWYHGFWQRNVGARSGGAYGFYDEAQDIMDNNQEDAVRTKDLLTAGLLTACSADSQRPEQPGSGYCEITSTEPEVGVGDTTSLGFSALDALGVLDTSFAVDVTDVDDAPAGTRTLDATFTIGTSAWVETREDPSEMGSCPAGSVVVAPAHLDIASTDRWFSASGDVRIVARSEDPSEIWVEEAGAYLAVAASAELSSAAFGVNDDRNSGCVDADVEIRFGLPAAEWTPWSEHPGWIDAATCDGSFSLYQWGPSFPLPP